jgi:hypothetical protein
LHSPQTVDRIEHLLASGAISQRGIQRLTGVSRASIAAIRAGRHPRQAVEGRESRVEGREPSIPNSDSSTPPLPHSSTAPLVSRCACGARVVQPCLACQLRARPGRIASILISAGRRIVEVEIEPVGIELVGDARRRYEQLLCAKRTRGEATAEQSSTGAMVRRPARRKTSRAAGNQLSLFDLDPPPWELDDAPSRRGMTNDE